jgi:hypothetical protein
MHWDIATAVQSVLDAINTGAGTLPGGLRLGTAAENRLRGYYTGTFTKEHARGANWNIDKFVVLPLAHLVGAYAAGDELGKSPSPPTEISEASAVKAAAVISITGWCRKQGKKTLGGYCDPPIGYTSASEASKALGPFLTISRKVLAGPGKAAAKKRGFRGKGAAESRRGGGATKAAKTKTATKAGKAKAGKAKAAKLGAKSSGRSTPRKVAPRTSAPAKRSSAKAAKRSARRRS